MQQKVWPFNLQLCAEGQQPVHMGIGLNSGEFIAGNIGSEDKIEFTLIGDTVNLTRVSSTWRGAIKCWSLRRPGYRLRIWSVLYVYPR